MTLDLTTLDAHEQPLDELKGIWKSYSKTDPSAFQNYRDIDDIHDPQQLQHFRSAGHIPSSTLINAFRELEGSAWDPLEQEIKDAPIYFHPLLPGLLILPSLIPPSTQKSLLSKMIHRDLSNPSFQTNLHLHYSIPYLPSSPPSSSSPTEEEEHPKSFFSQPPTSPLSFPPKDPSIHKPLSVKQVLDRKLSWLTLGGQYDWTNRLYPPSQQQHPPSFPPDIYSFLHALFPATLPQAAIVNFYKAGDTMMMHRDVSEETDRGLVSLSIGCDALFMIAPNNYANLAARKPDEDGKEGEKKPYLLLRLKSGDAVYMTQESRYAWHGVPKVLKGTCPDFLADWPAEDGKYEEWKGWMSNKRINLNVRQMKE